MTEYVATFFTHYAAMMTLRALKAAGACAVMEPVPRSLSASCGSCVRYRADSPMSNLMHADYQEIYRAENNGYLPVYGNDAAV